MSFLPRLVRVRRSPRLLEKRSLPRLLRDRQAQTPLLLQPSAPLRTRAEHPSQRASRRASGS